MRRHNVEELKNLLAGTTPGDWTESKIATVFRSSSHNRTQSQLMAQVKGDNGIAPSDHARANGILMSMARNFAAELLDVKTHTYGQEDCAGCDDRDGQVETAQESAAMWMRRADSFETEIERLRSDIRQITSERDTARVAAKMAMESNSFDAARLRRLANLVGAATPGPSDEELLGCAGTVLGSICRIVEGLLKTRELECKDCQHINFHEQCHEVQEKTAIRCIELAATFNDGHHPLGMQARIAAAIREEFGVEDGGICPECSSDSTITTQHMNGVQGDGQEAGVTTYLCLPCRNVWSE